MEKEEANLDWGRLKECCHVRFGPPMSNNSLGELANLRQTGTIEEYQCQFQLLLARITDLKPRQQVNLFTVRSFRVTEKMRNFFGNQQTNEGDKVGFGPPMSNNSLGELANLRQTGTIEEYQCQFQLLLARITDLKPRQQVNLFTVRLVEELQIANEIQQSKNLGVAMNMARRLERKQNVSSKLSS
ncbi:hypothetical protein GOBAR_DD34439 [Gossypium barbadense]|nr:hypothetical protein GOBAR_DD34439 [Gossypium barbadense]